MDKHYFLGLSEEGFHKVAYTEWGKPNNTHTPIICVHGLTRNGRDFDELARHLTYMGCHTYCPDVVGRGESDWLNDPLHYTYEQYIADMNVMIARTTAKQVDWVGTSMGGLIGLFLASMPKSPIRRLVLNDIGPQISTQGIARLSKYAGTEPRFRTLKEAKTYFQEVYGDFGKLSDAQWERFTENSVDEIRPGVFTTKMDPRIRIAATKSKIAWRAFLHPLKAWEGTLFDIDLWHIWRKVSCPVLVLRGKYSDILLPHVTQKMKMIHPLTEIVEIADAGHAPALMDLEQHELIYRWLMEKR